MAFSTIAGSGGWGEDGRIVFATGSSALLAVPAQGGEVTTLLAPDRKSEMDFHSASSLPGSKGALFAIHTLSDTRLAMFADGARKAGQLGLLGGVIAVGILSAGFVGVSEGIGAQEAAQNAKWNAMIDESVLDVQQANDLVIGVANRPGPWDATDSADMAKASVLYARIADAVDRVSAPAELDWYRTGMVKNFREAAAITHDFSLVTSASPASAVASLDSRWNAYVDEANRLSDRFDAQRGKTP